MHRSNNSEARAHGLGLTHGVCGEPANFTVSTRVNIVKLGFSSVPLLQGAGKGGLNIAVEGPSKADITFNAIMDGTVDVSFLPSSPGEYEITIKFADEHIPGSPFSCEITGEGGNC